MKQSVSVAASGVATCGAEGAGSAVGGEGRYGVGVQTVTVPVPPPPPSTQLGANTDQISVDFSTPCEHHQTRARPGREERRQRENKDKMLLMQDRVLGETVSSFIII